MEDDPIVKELDVFLTKRLDSAHLYVLQYPVRPTHKTYDSVDHLSARIKPRQRRVELTVSLDSEANSYNERKGAEIASNATSSRGGAGASCFEGDLMDRQLLTSSPVACEGPRYAVCALRDNQLHLTPVSAVVELRPSYGYLDSADTSKEAGVKAQAAEKLAMSAAESSCDEEPQSIQPIYSQLETDEMRARRTSSYKHLKQQEDSEAWVPLQFHALGDSRAKQHQRLLYAEDTTRTMTEQSEFKLTADTYLKKVIAGVDAADAPVVAAKLSAESTWGDIRQKSLSEQILRILINCKVMRFSRLMELLAGKASVAAVLALVPQVAMLVQGCWVVKSAHLYPENSVSAYDRRVTWETLGRARDYVMWRFTLCHGVTRKDVADVVRIPAEDERTIFEQLAVRNTAGGAWCFNHEFDEEFVLQHAEIVTRQSRLWELKESALCAALSINREAIVACAPVEASLVGGRVKKYGSTDDTVLDDSASAAVSSSLLDALAGCGGGGAEELMDLPDLTDLDSILHHNGSATDAGMEGLVEGGGGDIILGAACNGHRVEVNPAGADYTSQQQLRTALTDFIREKLRARFVLSLSDLKELFSIRLAELPPGHVLGAGVSDHLLELCLLNADAVQISAANSKLYVNRRCGDALDNVRDVIVRMLSERPVIRISTLRKKFDDAVADEELKRVLKEYCFTSGGSWHLKGTKG